VKNNVVILLFLTVFLVSCTNKIKQQETEKPEPLLVWQEDSEGDSRAEELRFIEQLFPPEPELIAEENRFDVSANNTPIKSFLMSLVHGTNYNLIVHEGLEGKVSLNLKSVTVLETLDAVRDIYGYDYAISSYGIQVYPRTVQTRAFPINYLNVSR